MQNMERSKNTYPRWMNLKTAAWYSSIGQKRLKQLAKEKKITGYRDPEDGRRGWIFDRLSIDRYRENPSKQDDEFINHLLKGIQ